MYPERPPAIIGPLGRLALVTAALASILAACQPAGAIRTKPSSPGKIQHPTGARCVLTKATPGVLERTGTGRPAAGNQWDVLRCPGMNPNAIGGALIQVPIHKPDARRGSGY